MFQLVVNKNVEVYETSIIIKAIIKPNQKMPINLLITAGLHLVKYLTSMVLACSQHNSQKFEARCSRPSSRPLPLPSRVRLQRKRPKPERHLRRVHPPHGGQTSG